MTEQTSLDDIFNGAPPPEPKAEVVETKPEEEQPEGKAEEPTGVEAASPAAEKPPEKPPEGYVPHEALNAERRRRQDVEQEISRLRTEVEALRKPPAEKVDLLSDPDKWEQQLQERVNQEVERVRNESNGRFIQLLEQQARAQYDDFEDVAGFFAEIAKENPALIAEANQQPNPVEYAYRAGKHLRMLKEAGSLDALIQRERDAARAEALKEQKSVSVPESLTDLAGARTTTKAWSPSRLDELLPKI